MIGKGLLIFSELPKCPIHEPMNLPFEFLRRSFRFREIKEANLDGHSDSSVNIVRAEEFTELIRIAIIDSVTTHHD